MFSIERLRDELPQMPPLVRGGLIGLLVATVLDLPAHVGAGGHVGHDAVGDPGDVLAHVGIVVAMSLILFGVVVDGIRRGRANTGGVE